MGVHVTGAADAADAARLRALSQDALEALGSPGLDLPVWVVDSHPQGWEGWAGRRGVYIVADQLDGGDDELAWLVVEEVARHHRLNQHVTATEAVDTPLCERRCGHFAARVVVRRRLRDFAKSGSLPSPTTSHLRAPPGGRRFALLQPSRASASASARGSRFPPSR
jgi:hypothetical protein